MNSLVKILSLTKPAALPEVKDADWDPALQIIRAELSELRWDMQDAIRVARGASRGPDHLRALRAVPPDVLESALSKLHPREAKVLRLGLGLEGRAFSIAEISEMIGMSPNAVRRVLDAEGRTLRMVSRKFVP